jgi:homoserine dehydrogenase
MANTVPVLSFTNTFGDLLAQQNRAAIELNTLAANNYTKDSGTLFLNGAGTGLQVTAAAL